MTTTTTPSVGEMTTTITEERTTITKGEENTIPDLINDTKDRQVVEELDKGKSEIKEKPLEQIIIVGRQEPLPESVVSEEKHLPNGGTKITTIEETNLEQNGDDTVRKSVVQTEEYELNNDVSWEN